MLNVLGIDTSNYTTSASLIDTDNMTVYQSKMILPVKCGEVGVRQSDAVFHHTRQLPYVISDLLKKADIHDFNINAVGASVSPRPAEGSYMPCFLVGEGFASSFSELCRIDLYKTSHQLGHILAALYSTKKLDLLRNKENFIAFHISGGTTDCLLCEPSEDDVLKVSEIGTSLDLNAGQAIDRIGVKLGLDFPCGAQLEKMALLSRKSYKTKAVIKGNNCCLSGLQNICEKMLSDGEETCDIAKFCITYISDTILAMSERARETFKNAPIIFAGGVTSDKIIKNEISAKLSNVYFAEPEFSCDNAVGVALYAAIKKELI